MKWASVFMLSFSCVLLAVGCGGDDDDSSSASACHDGCVATVAAGCENGPDQATCESDCKTFESSSCGTQFKAVRSCYQGKDIACNADGNPSVAACSAQEDAFVACLIQ